VIIFIIRYILDFLASSGKTDSDAIHLYEALVFVLRDLDGKRLDTQASYGYKQALIFDDFQLSL
jgi:hypothetical protein